VVSGNVRNIINTGTKDSRTSKDQPTSGAAVGLSIEEATRRVTIGEPAPNSS
jgi:hypothetical protein